MADPRKSLPMILPAIINLKGNDTSYNDRSMEETVDEFKDNVGGTDSTSNVYFNGLAFFLIIFCSSIIIIGVPGNLIILHGFLSRKKLREKGNIFILTLAISDSILSLIVLPINLMEVSSNHYLTTLLQCGQLKGTQAILQLSWALKTF